MKMAACSCGSHFAPGALELGQLGVRPLNSTLQLCRYAAKRFAFGCSNNVGDALPKIGFETLFGHRSTQAITHITPAQLILVQVTAKSLNATLAGCVLASRT